MHPHADAALVSPIHARALARLHNHTHTYTHTCSHSSNIVSSFCSLAVTKNARVFVLVTANMYRLLERPFETCGDLESVTFSNSYGLSLRGDELVGNASIKSVQL